jgi:cyclophilin family peptidyl-prolyl cis-trans isomerase
MANTGQKNTNNSQFFITTSDCSHLNGINVVFGNVVRGLGVITALEEYVTNTGLPLKVMGDMRPNFQFLTLRFVEFTELHNCKQRGIALTSSPRLGRMRR